MQPCDDSFGKYNPVHSQRKCPNQWLHMDIVYFGEFYERRSVGRISKTRNLFQLIVKQTRVQPALPRVRWRLPERRQRTCFGVACLRRTRYEGERRAVVSSGRYPVEVLSRTSPSLTVRQDRGSRLEEPLASRQLSGQTDPGCVHSGRSVVLCSRQSDMACASAFM